MVRKTEINEENRKFVDMAKIGKGRGQEDFRMFGEIVVKVRAKKCKEEQLG